MGAALQADGETRFHVCGLNKDLVLDQSTTGFDAVDGAHPLLSEHQVICKQIIDLEPTIALRAYVKLTRI